MFGSIQDISIEDIRLHPEKLADIVLASNDYSIMLERRADIVHITYLKSYDQKAKYLVDRARQEHHAKTQSGYDRKQAFSDILEAQDEIAAQLQKSSDL